MEECNPQPMHTMEKRNMTRQFRALFQALQDAELNTSVETKHKACQVELLVTKVIYKSRSPSPRSPKSGGRARTPEVTHRAVNTFTIPQRHQSSQTMERWPSPPHKAEHSFGSTHALPRQELSFGKAGLPAQK